MYGAKLINNKCILLCIGAHNVVRMFVAPIMQHIYFTPPCPVASLLSQLSVFHRKLCVKTLQLKFILVISYGYLAKFRG